MEQQNAAANGGQVAAPETEDNMEKDASPQEAAAAQQSMEEMPFEQAHRQEEDSERTTKAFSQRLKREKEKYDKEYEPYRELFEEMRAMGVSAQSPGELLELLRAQNGQHQWIEQQREAENARQMLREAIETDPSYLAAKEMAYEKMYADDLAAIKEVFPEVTASHVSELGEVYLSLMGAGLSDVVAAYAAARAVKERTTKPSPQSMGSVANARGEEKEYYSPADVDRLPKEAYNNPGIMAKIKKSMTKC